MGELPPKWLYLSSFAPTRREGVAAARPREVRADRLELDEVTAHARERLGLETQAANRLRPAPAGHLRLRAWSLMTEHGRFWLVEGGGEVELLYAPRTRVSKLPPWT